jgi:hypothetical protein
MSKWENIEDVVDDDDNDIEAQTDDEMYTGQNSQEEKTPSSNLVNPRAEAHRKLAAIPEAVTPLRTSKRRADMADQHSLERAERIKAACNLDSTPNLGNTTTSHASFLQFSNEKVVHNLNAVGISL